MGTKLDTLERQLNHSRDVVGAASQMRCHRSELDEKAHLAQQVVPERAVAGRGEVVCEDEAPGMHNGMPAGSRPESHDNFATEEEWVVLPAASLAEPGRVDTRSLPSPHTTRTKRSREEDQHEEDVERRIRRVVPRATREEREQTQKARANADGAMLLATKPQPEP